VLTKRQKEVLLFIKNYIDKHDYAPSLEEIKRYLHLSSVSTAHYHVQALQSSGYLNKVENRPRALDIFKNQNFAQIPLLGTISAGSPIEAIENKENVLVPQDKIRNNDNCFALRVKGQSMIEENIQDGDLVLVKQQTTAENGQKIVALIDNDQATLKKYYRERGHIRLQPANPNFEPIIIKKNQSLTIQGVVLDIIKRNSSIPEQLFESKSPKGKTVKEKNIDEFIDQIIEGDCLEAMKQIPSKSIDMILCDLPYGTTQNHWDSIIPLNRIWEHYERIIKDKGVIALTAQGLFTANLMLSNQRMFKYKIVWVKSKPTNFLNAKKQPLRKHEDIVIFYKKQPDYNPQKSNGEPYNKGFRKDQLTGSYGDFKTVEVKSNGERYPTDVIYFKTSESEGSVYHPTQKPIELGRYLIKTFTKPGDIVLDNACGSGSFLVAATLEGRKFIGIEKNEKVYLHKKHRVDYIEICRNRISEATKELKVVHNRLS